MGIDLKVGTTDIYSIVNEAIGVRDAVGWCRVMMK